MTKYEDLRDCWKSGTLLKMDVFSLAKPDIFLVPRQFRKHCALSGLVSMLTIEMMRNGCQIAELSSDCNDQTTNNRAVLLSDGRFRRCGIPIPHSLRYVVRPHSANP